MPRVAHLIGDLDGFGGTEATLLRYLEGSRLPKEDQRVFVLRHIGVGDALGAQMVRMGVTVVELGQPKGFVTPLALHRLRVALADFAPDVLSGWLYHPSLLAALMASLLARRPTVVWHIRSMPFAAPWRKPGRWAVQRLLSVAARHARPLIVSNSVATANAHAAMGIGPGDSNWNIIPNGIDLDRFGPDAADRLAARRELSLPDDAIVLVCIGRFVTEKGYPVLFQALSSALAQLPRELATRVHLVAAGNGVASDNPAFAAVTRPCEAMAPRMRLLGKRPDVEHLLRAADLFVLPSISESFPNALIEAMACALPCVATDVGPVRGLLEDPRFVARCGDAVSLAGALAHGLSLSSRDRSRVGDVNRERVCRRHGQPEMVRRFDELFEQSARHTGARH